MATKHRKRGTIITGYQKCKSKLQYSIISHLLEWLKSEIKTITSVNVHVGKLESSCTAGGNVK